MIEENYYISDDRSETLSESGELGFFIHRQGYLDAISPVFDSFEPLLNWMESNGFERVYEGLPPHLKVRRTQRTVIDAQERSFYPKYGG